MINIEISKILSEINSNSMTYLQLSDTIESKELKYIETEGLIQINNDSTVILSDKGREIITNSSSEKTSRRNQNNYRGLRNSIIAGLIFTFVAIFLYEPIRNYLYYEKVKIEKDKKIENTFNDNNNIEQDFNLSDSINNLEIKNTFRDSNIIKQEF